LVIINLRAAKKIGKNRSEFILEAACREATELLLDPRLFLVDEKAYKRFVDALDAPPAENKSLKRLLMTNVRPGKREDSSSGLCSEFFV